jgi:hypothetical protein
VKAFEGLTHWEIDDNGTYKISVMKLIHNYIIKNKLLYGHAQTTRNSFVRRFVEKTA